MSVYNKQGDSIGVNDTPFLSCSPFNRARLCGEDFDVSSFSLIHNFTPFSTDYSTDSATPRVLNITAAEFLSTFYEPYLGWHDGLMVSKKIIGRDKTNTYDVWCYDFTPRNAKRKVLLSSGMHTYELPASFGLARWVKEFMESDAEVFEYLRNNVAFSIVPIINPWGFNQNPKTYGNNNGVNPNRNFNDWSGAWQAFPNYTPSQNEWNVKGSSPFSEAETQNLCEWVKSNMDASFYIDCHTGLGNSKGDVWLYYLSNNPLLAKITAAYNALISYYQTTFGGGTGTKTIDDATCIDGKYYQNVLGMPKITIEQTQGVDVHWGATVPNNNPTAIKEYARQIHAFVLSMLME